MSHKLKCNRKRRPIELHHCETHNRTQSKLKCCDVICFNLRRIHLETGNSLARKPSLVMITVECDINILTRWHCHTLNWQFKSCGVILFILWLFFDLVLTTYNEKSRNYGCVKGIFILTSGFKTILKFSILEFWMCDSS